MAKKNSHYIDNERFFDEMCKWKKEYDENKEKGLDPPRLTEYIGQCFLDIATNLARKENFMNYPYKEEMISDGVENCVMYCYNFNPEKSKNPFSYFTQIIYFAFLRRIDKEKKQTYTKYELIMNSDVSGDYRNFLSATYNKKNTEELITEEEVLEKHLDITPNDIDKYSKKTKKTDKKQSITGSTLDGFLS